MSLTHSSAFCPTTRQRAFGPMWYLVFRFISTAPNTQEEKYSTALLERAEPAPMGTQVSAHFVTPRPSPTQSTVRCRPAKETCPAMRCADLAPGSGTLLSIVT